MNENKTSWTYAKYLSKKNRKKEAALKQTLPKNEITEKLDLDLPEWIKGEKQPWTYMARLKALDKVHKHDICDDRLFLREGRLYRDMDIFCENFLTEKYPESLPEFYAMWEE